MERKKTKAKLPMLCIDLIIAAALTLAVALFALLYSEGGANILTAAANEAEPSPNPEAGLQPDPDASPSPSPTPASVQKPVSTEGRLIPYLENGLWGYKNTAGETAISPRFSAACEFDGDTAFAAENGYYGLLAKNGVWIVEPVWEAVDVFSEGLAAVESGGKWGFIEKPVRS